MRLPIYQVDAFADELFTGNPAAVVLCSEVLPDELMQAIAAENNLAETAFVMVDDDPPWIRWFTPTVEVDLCGHATLAAAHVLFDASRSSGLSIEFGSKSGRLGVSQRVGRLWLDFPADTPRIESECPPELTAGLGVTPAELHSGRDDLLAILDSQEAVLAVSPDFQALAQVECRGIIVSAPGDEVDFVCRFFAPRVGVPEDPVTGSAYTLLAPFWSERLGMKSLSARQLSQRGGSVRCEDSGARVHIGGHAVTYLCGEISV